MNVRIIYAIFLFELGYKAVSLTFWHSPFKFSIQIACNFAFLVLSFCSQYNNKFLVMVERRLYKNPIILDTHYLNFSLKSPNTRVCNYSSLIVPFYSVFLSHTIVYTCACVCVSLSCLHVYLTYINKMNFMLLLIL